MLQRLVSKHCGCGIESEHVVALDVWVVLHIVAIDVVLYSRYVYLYVQNRVISVWWLYAMLLASKDMMEGNQS